MSHLLDTNICAAHFRRPGGLAHRFIQYCGGLYVPTIVLGELYAGAYHVQNPTPLLQKISDLLIDVRVLDFDHACSEEFGKIRGLLLQRGISVPTVDLMIAAVALVHDLTLVTNNTADFRHIPGLTLDDWLKPSLVRFTRAPLRSALGGHVFLLSVRRHSLIHDIKSGYLDI